MKTLVIINIFITAFIGLYSCNAATIQDKALQNDSLSVQEMVDDWGNPDSLQESLRKLIDKKHEIVRISNVNNSDELTKFYLKEKTLGDKNGYVPVIIELSDNLMAFAAERNHAPATINDINDNKYISKAVAKAPDEFKENQDFMVKNFGEEAKGSSWAEYVGKKEDASGQAINTIEYTPQNGFYVLVRFFVEKPDEIFTLITPENADGGINHSIHRVYARYWNEKYKAVPCFISYDETMYYVPRPVDATCVFQLAQEQDTYCIDIVSQINLSIWNLAKSLEISNFWYFWWD